MLFKKSCLLNGWKVLFSCLKLSGRGLWLKNLAVFGKVLRNKPSKHKENLVYFSNFQYGFRSFCLVVILLTVSADRIYKPCNMSIATQAKALKGARKS